MPSSMDIHGFITQNQSSRAAAGRADFSRNVLSRCRLSISAGAHAFDGRAGARRPEDAVKNLNPAVGEGMTL